MISKKKHLCYDAGYGDINGTVWIEYCKIDPESKTISDNQVEDPSNINLEGKWKDCDGMSYGFKLIKNGANYSMQRIKGYFVPIECIFKKKGDLFSGCDGDAEMRYDKSKKRLIYWDAGGNDAEYCRIE